MINVPMLRKTLEYIEHNPEDWNQDFWGTHYYPSSWQRQHSMVSCATVCCFAGNAVLLAGGEFVAGANDLVELDGVRSPANEAARNLLGLTYDQANKLFYCGNTLAGLRRIVGDLVDQAEAVEGD